MTSPDDWSDLSQAWTKTPQEPLRPDAALLRAVRRRDRLAWLNFVCELVGGGVVLGVVGWAVVARGLPWPAALAAVLFAVFALGMTLWSRRGDPGLLLETPDGVLRSAIAQAQRGRRWAWAGMAISVAGLVFIGAIAVLAPTGSDRSVAPLWIGVVTLFGCIAGYAAYARRCRRRMSAHEATLRALSEP